LEDFVVVGQAALPVKLLAETEVDILATFEEPADVDTLLIEETVTTVLDETTEGEEMLAVTGEAELDATVVELEEEEAECSTVGPAYEGRTNGHVQGRSVSSGPP